jgi:DNA invertase Pin-like site-specific DNA recombinase
MRVGIYARFSSDLQRETSIVDQTGVARQYAATQGWAVLEDHIYSDAGISGASIEGRPGLQALIAASAASPRPFDVLLVDDSSRIARDLADALRTMQTLKFRGVRVIYISQGIDSASEQADSLIAMHGLVDQLYLKEMAKKIKRGLAGQLDRGFVTGGKTYGYRTVGVPSGKTDVDGNPELVGKRRIIQPDEAAIVRQIYEWAASGVGVFTITRRLQESTSGPWGNPWSQNVIRRILRNEVYLGKLIWGRVNYERQPGTNKMVCRKQPREQWKTVEQPELRIISDDLWQAVRERESVVQASLRGGNLARGRLPGYQSKYLLSGFVKCGLCGGGYAIVSSNKRVGPRYGCRRSHREYTCTNRIVVRPSVVEARVLEKLQAELLQPERVDYIIREAIRRAAEAEQKPAKRDQVAKQLDQERKKLQNLVRALEDGQPATAILTALRSREESIHKLELALAAIQPPRPTKPIDPDAIRKELGDLAGLLRGSVERARPVLQKLDFRVRLYPIEPEGHRPYLKAVATATLEALKGELPLLSRSLEGAASVRGTVSYVA